MSADLSVEFERGLSRGGNERFRNAVTSLIARSMLLLAGLCQVEAFSKHPLITCTGARFGGLIPAYLHVAYLCAFPVQEAVLTEGDTVAFSSAFRPDVFAMSGVLSRV